MKGQKSKVKSQRSKVKGQRSKVKSQRSKVHGVADRPERSAGKKVKGQKSKVKGVINSAGRDIREYALPFLQGVLCLLCKLTRRTYYSQRPPDVARCDFPASGPDESGCV